MQEQLNQLVEAAKKDHRILKQLKETAVKAKLYELGAKLREIEKERAYPFNYSGWLNC